MSKTYKIGEAAALLNLKTYVLRFWETEFPEIIPLRTEKGQRMYAEEHIALLERIRYLLHDRGLTIGGARKALEEERERGLVYTFGVAGAIARDAPRAARHAPDMDLYDPDEDDDAEETSPACPEHLLGMDGPLPMRPLARNLIRRKGQCNLPGIEERLVMTEHADADADAPMPPPEDQAMLPLFSMIKNPSARPDNLSGGGNFIQTGAPPGPPVTSGPPGPPNKAPAGAAPETRPEASARTYPSPPGFSLTGFADLLAELDHIAALLKGTGQTPDQEPDQGPDQGPGSATGQAADKASGQTSGQTSGKATGVPPHSLPPTAQDPAAPREPAGTAPGAPSAHAGPFRDPSGPPPRTTPEANPSTPPRGATIILTRPADGNISPPGLPLFQDPPPEKS